MKILYVADLHYSLKQFDWLVANADPYDVVAIGGDLLDVGGLLDPDVQIVVVEKYFGDCGGKRLCLSPPEITMRMRGMRPANGSRSGCSRRAVKAFSPTATNSPFRNSR